MVSTVKVVDFIKSTGEMEQQDGLGKTICKAINIKCSNKREADTSGHFDAI